MYLQYVREQLIALPRFIAFIRVCGFKIQKLPQHTTAETSVGYNTLSPHNNKYVFYMQQYA